MFERQGFSRPDLETDRLMGEKESASKTQSRVKGTRFARPHLGMT